MSSLASFTWHRLISWWMAAPLEVEGRPPTPHRPQRAVAKAHGRRDRTVRPPGGDGHPLPL
ncbi:hypothetical protein [Streptomyces sp. NA02950]|uniref:hypothetical protein n=1 Tax=Streptomyces sp. NA02950 TaxID=2742137 RepID=UPI0020CAE783|nr:hypothetical protein [Streptomyces sp. NA02950]